MIHSGSNMSADTDINHAGWQMARQPRWTHVLSLLKCIKLLALHMILPTNHRGLYLLWPRIPLKLKYDYSLYSCDHCKFCEVPCLASWLDSIRSMAAWEGVLETQASLALGFGMWNPYTSELGWADECTPSLCAESEAMQQSVKEFRLSENRAGMKQVPVSVCRDREGGSVSSLPFHLHNIVLVIYLLHMLSLAYKIIHTLLHYPNVYLFQISPFHFIIWDHPINTNNGSFIINSLVRWCRTALI